jgi:NAD-dependent dihydropyrimidine dehydrogenase PreA subunit
MHSMTLLDQFVTAFGVWEEARPYLHLMVDEQEMQLVVAMAGQAITVSQAAGRLGLTPQQAAELLQRAYGRHLVDKSQADDGTATYSAGTFYSHLDHVAKYGRWDEIPAEDRRTINRRFLDEFIARHRPNVELKMQGLQAENALPNDTVLLLSQVEEMIDAATHIVVQPCDCRRLGQNCDRPVETCLWLDAGALEALDRGYGRRLTRDEARELVHRADRAGLMHTADSEWRSHGLHAICNCCACDCYPFRAAQELGSKGIWPRSHYIAVYDQERCDLCGACVKRCHFNAFYHDGSTGNVGGKARPGVAFDPESCWGCGLCANTCPTHAIVMEPLEPRPVTRH